MKVGCMINFLILYIYICIRSTVHIGHSIHGSSLSFQHVTYVICGINLFFSLLPTCPNLSVIDSIEKIYKSIYTYNQTLNAPGRPSGTGSF